MRSLVTAIALLTLTAGAAAAEDLGSCRFHLPPETKTIVYGVYTGGLRSTLRLVDEGHQIKRVEVRVPKKDVPLFVVLTAYDPVEWDLKIDDGASIAGVLVMGFHHQAVSNLPPDIRVGFTTRLSGPGSECPKPLYAYGRGGEDYQKLTRLLSNEFSRSVDEFYGSYGADCLYKGCVVSAPRQRTFWQALFGSGSAVAARPQFPVQASTRIIR